MEEQGKAAAYLQQKYGKEFVVKDDPNPMVKRALGDPPKFDGLAHATDDPDLTFWVGRQTSPPGEFKDNYLSILWTKQATDGEVHELVKQIFGKIPEYHVTVNPQTETSTEAFFGRTPDFSEAKGSIAQDLFYMLDIRLSGDLAAASRTKHLANIYELVQFMQDGVIGEPSIYYRVFSDKKGKSAVQQCHIDRDQLRSIRSAEELSGCLK